MKKIMYTLFFLSCLFLLGSMSFPQLNFEENFDYPAGDSLNTHGWVAHSQPGVNPVMIIAGSLSYPGYSSSDIGNSVDVIGSTAVPSREDLTATFNIDSVSNVYCSFLVKVVSIGAQVDYFFHFREDPVAAILRGRVMLQNNGSGGFNFGISKGSTTVIDWDTTARTFNETYLIVLKYEYIVGTDNDLIHLFVNPPLTGIEPSTPDATVPDTNTDIIVNAVSIRQGSRDYFVQLDGIRVATSWSLAPIPVELVGFFAQANKGGVLLTWATASETNNKMFEVQRKSNNLKYTTVAQVNGSGTSTHKKFYSYLDSNVEPGNYMYRLKQIDFDGRFEYSNEIEVYVNTQLDFSLQQNYPNPFNPATTIGFGVREKSRVRIAVLNTIGEEVAVVLNEETEPGYNKVEFNASNLPSGVYFYRIQAGNFIDTKKMILLK